MDDAQAKAVMESPIYSADRQTLPEVIMRENLVRKIDELPPELQNDFK